MQTMTRNDAVVPEVFRDVFEAGKAAWNSNVLAPAVGNRPIRTKENPYMAGSRMGMFWRMGYDAAAETERADRNARSFTN